MRRRENPAEFAVGLADRFLAGLRLRGREGVFMAHDQLAHDQCKRHGETHARGGKDDFARAPALRDAAHQWPDEENHSDPDQAQAQARQPLYQQISLMREKEQRHEMPVPPVLVRC